MLRPGRKNGGLALTLLGLCLWASPARAEVIVSEIMYNPASDETAPGLGEWVELYNNGTAPVDIGGWRLDDEDAGDWGTIPTGTTLGAGQFAIMLDAAFTNEATFRTEWAVPQVTPVFAITWASLANGPSPTNEMLQLLNAAGAVQDEVKYGDTGFTITPNGPSLHLFQNQTAAGNDSGANWAVSSLATGSRNPSGPTFSTADIANPGVLAVPEPTSLGLVALGGLFMLRRRRA